VAGVVWRKVGDYFFPELLVFSPISIPYKAMNLTITVRKPYVTHITDMKASNSTQAVTHDFDLSLSYGPKKVTRAMTAQSVQRGTDESGSIPGRDNTFSPLHSVQTGSGAHPAFYSMGTEGSFPWG
jgi:hypothetical protein